MNVRKIRVNPCPIPVCAYGLRALASLLLSLLLLLVYGGAGWITSQRADVRTWYFEWELSIPFLPIMVIPYLSLDLFFVAAPFLCPSEPEIKILARRISFAILAAGAGFLLLPLRLGFERREAGGLLSGIFDAFLSLDGPYNLFPSLHITLCCILAGLYLRRTKGLVRTALAIWFVLIGFSTLLTHQHQVVDVLGGAALACLCLYLFHESAVRLPVATDLKIGSYYGMAAVAALTVAVVTWPWGSLLLWPGTALGIAAAGYCGLGPGIYRKTEGKLPWISRILLSPLLAGQFMSLLYYRRQCRAWDEVVPGVWVGRKLSRREAREAVSRGVVAVLDLTAEFAEAAPFLATRYRQIPILDLAKPMPDQLREAASFISEQAERGTVYVHCKIGYSRSAAAVAAYLLVSRLASTAEEAAGLLRRVRPSIVIRPEVMQALRDFERGTSPAAILDRFDEFGCLASKSATSQPQIRMFEFPELGGPRP